MPENTTDKPARKQPHAQYEMAKKAQGAIGRLGDAPQPDPLHRRPAVEAMTGLSRSTIYAKLDANPVFKFEVGATQLEYAFLASARAKSRNSFLHD